MATSPKRKKEAKEHAATPQAGTPSPEPQPTTATQEPAQEHQSREDELTRQLQRLHADFDNYRKRVERDAQETRAHAAASLLKELIPACDHLALAIAHARAQGNQGELLDGVAMVYEQLLSILAERGAQEIPTSGRFDPQLHEAILTVKDESKDNGTILETLQRGYTLAGKVLRPARVSVVKNH